MRRLAATIIVLAWLAHSADAAPARESLPHIGPAPAFTLMAQDGRRVSLDALHDKVVALTFIYASCVDTCPLLTAKMATMQRRLGDEFGRRVAFVSITVDPERDTPEVLRRYAEAHGVRSDGWWFLTGSASDIKDVTRR